VDYDLAFSPDLFSPVVYAMPDFASEPQMPLLATVSPAPTFSGTDPLGMVYAFVSDNLYPVPHIRLVRIPASCALRVASCPQAEVIEPPAPLIYSIPPLVWSPTHEFAAFAYPIKEDGNGAALFLFDPNNNSWKSLAEFAFIDPPMWSRDGTWLAFRVQDGQGGSEVYVVRRNGSDLKQLTASGELPAEGQPYIMDTWLGGNVILRSAKPGQTGTLYLMRVEDGAVQPLFEALLTKSALVESPDGTLLAYVDYDYVSEKQLVKLITPDGNTLRDLATFATPSILGLAWSPDGGQLAFSHVVDATSVIYVIDSDGRNLRQVYSGDSGTGFLFSPDGKTLLIQTIDGTGQHLYTIDLASLEARLVLVPGIGLNETWMQPSWRK
jgi:Tol biopolymer transport system component